MWQGDTGDRLYMILDGSAVVLQSKAGILTTIEGKNPVTEIAQLGPGQIFGELALLNNAPRKAVS